LTIHVRKTRNACGVISLRAERIQQNLRSRAPHRAQLAHLWPLWGDESICDGCGGTIETDDIEYELQFSQTTETVSIRLHRDCWENWRVKELRSERPRWPPSRHPSAQRWFLCTRHSDGRFFCAEQIDLPAALSGLRTFLDTARQLGYQVRSEEPVLGPRTTHIARQDSAWVMFWVSEGDESTAAFGAS
jgi:hypothetical protein